MTAGIAGLLLLGIIVAIAIGGSGQGNETAAGGSPATETGPSADELASAREEASRDAAEQESRAAAEEASREAAEEARRAEEEARLAAEEEQRRAEEEALAAAEAARSDPASYAQISDRDWALVERDPNAHAGERYVIYGHITQFDANTGPDGFRANTSGEPKGRWYDYDINTIVIAADSELVSDVVTDDLATMYVEVLDAYSYQTTIGGEITAPRVHVNIISVDGHAG